MHRLPQSMLPSLPKPSWLLVQLCLARAHWSRRPMPERCACLIALRQRMAVIYPGDQTEVGGNRAGSDNRHRLIGHPSNTSSYSEDGSRYKYVHPAAPKGPVSAAPPRWDSKDLLQSRCALRGVDEKVENTQQVSRRRGREGGAGQKLGRRGGRGELARRRRARRELSTWPCASSAAARRIARAAVAAGARRTGRPARRPAG